MINEVQTGVRDRNIGKYVHYEVDITGDSSYDNDWRVFYEENNMTYLIAADYMLSDKIPSETGMETNKTYNAWWDSFKSSGATNISNEIVSKYKLSWWYDNSESTNKNAKATADLLNPSLWSDLAIYDGIEAIGAPTLEMFIASWNVKEYETLYWDYNEIGYTIGLEKNPTTRNINLKSIESKGYYDSLYFPHISDGTNEIFEDVGRYFLASPNGGGKSSLFSVAVKSGLGSAGVAGIDCALRPIIAVPSSLISEDENSNTQIYFIEH